MIRQIIIYYLKPIINFNSKFFNSPKSSNKSKIKN